MGTRARVIDSSLKSALAPCPHRAVAPHEFGYASYTSRRQRFTSVPLRRGSALMPTLGPYADLPGHSRAFVFVRFSGTACASSSSRGGLVRAAAPLRSTHLSPRGAARHSVGLVASRVLPSSWASSRARCGPPLGPSPPLQAALFGGAWSCIVVAAYGPRRPWDTCGLSGHGRGPTASRPVAAAYGPRRRRGPLSGLVGCVPSAPFVRLLDRVPRILLYWNRWSSVL